MKRRYEILDILRGFALINMIAYHACWDLVYLFDVSLPWYHGTGAYIWQQCICHTFILLSGFCACFGKNPIKRGLFVLLCSVVVSIGASFAGTTIYFGVLTLLGFGQLCYGLCKNALNKAHPYIGAGASLLAFVLCRRVPYGTLAGAALPKWLYANHFTALLGFPHDAFYSSDYFPLVPWLFLFALGIFLQRIFAKHDLSRLLHTNKCKLLGLCGKYSLYIYMLHQPLTYAALFLFFSL